MNLPICFQSFHLKLKSYQKRGKKLSDVSTNLNLTSANHFTVAGTLLRLFFPML